MLLTTTVTNTNISWIANIDWSKPSWDLFIVLFFLVAAFLYGLSLGRDRIIVILVSIYMSLAIINTAPFIGLKVTEISVSSLFAVRITAFLGLFIILFFLLSRSALLKTIASSDTQGSWWQVIIFSFLHVGLLISIILSYLPSASINTLAPLTQTIFTTETSRFIWIILPVLAMVMIKGGAGDHPKRYKYDQ